MQTKPEKQKGRNHKGAKISEIENRKTKETKSLSFKE
jgi:hypothetical protein